MDKWRTNLTQVHYILGCNFFMSGDDERGNNDDDLLHENIQIQAAEGGGEFLN